MELIVTVLTLTLIYPPFLLTRYRLKGKELAFAFGLNLSVARLGSVMNNLLSPGGQIEEG